jgi:hypothetical protein
MKIPKEQAKDMVDSFIQRTRNKHERKAMSYRRAKKCALIAIESIVLVPKHLLYTIYIHRFRTFEEIDINSWNEEEPIIVEEFTALEYWYKVKEEIELL